MVIILIYIALLFDIVQPELRETFVCDLPPEEEFFERAAERGLAPSVNNFPHEEIVRRRKLGGEVEEWSSGRSRREEETQEYYSSDLPLRIKRSEMHENFLFKEVVLHDRDVTRGFPI